MKAFRFGVILGLILYCLFPDLTYAQDQLPKKVLDAVTAKMMLEAVGAVSSHDHKLMMQSPGCSGYSFGQPGYQLLTPSEEAASGAPTATITVQPDVKDSSGKQIGVLSHSVTVTAAGTKLSFTYTGNGTSANLKLYKGTTLLSNQSWPLNASTPDAWITNSNETGDPYKSVFTVTGTNGQVAQDQIIFSVVAGSSPGIVNQDAVSTNLYVRFNPNFGGGDMMHTCQICIQQPSACLGAQHTPYLTASVTNNTSGQTVSLARQVAGTVVDENSPISGSLFLPQDISVLPGDDISGGATGEIFCSAEQDNIWNQFISWRVEYGKTVVKDLGHPPRYNAADKSYLYDVAPICDNNSDPADWQPSVVHSWSGRHTYWFGVTSLLRWPDVPATKWIAAADIMVDWTTAGPHNGIIDLITMAVEGGSIPYPGGSGPDFPVPGACTRFVGFDSHTGKPYYNVILTLGSGDLPWWPQLN